MNTRNVILFDPPFAPRAGRRSRRSGCLDVRLEDEIDGDGSRMFGARLYYEWDAYDRSDVPRAPWGARIVGLEVLSVQCEGAATVSRDTAQLAAAAWNLVERDFEALEDRCTRAGMEGGVGSADPLALLRTARDRSPQCVMAPSVRTTSRATPRTRKWG